MADFKFYHPITVRYGDLDPQGHVNNAKYLTYLEQARLAYLTHLELWKGGSFLSIGIILAEVKVSFLKPILFGQDVHIGACVSRLGNKSFDMEYVFTENQGDIFFATATSVLVAYDYPNEKTIPIPPNWRQRIIEFEQLQP